MKSVIFTIAAVIALLFVTTPAIADDQSWADRIKLKADIRLRHESVDEDGEEDRARGRFRTRFGLSAQATDDVKFVLQLATGGSNPVSTNQTFDGGFSTKDIGVDLAYVDWKINDNLNLYGGKMKNPLFKAGGVPLIWDGDLNLEGIAVTFSQGNFFGTAGNFSAEERSSTDDSLLYVVQAGFKVPIGDAMKLTAGAGYFAYTDTVGNEPFFNGNPRGNSVDVDGNYLYDYTNTEIFAQLDTNAGDWPLRIYAHATQNSDAPTEDTAFAIGAKLGSAKKQGQTEFSWTYQDIEADAVIGTFNDSDFGGGGTDSSGHMLKYKYMLRDTISLGGSLFINEIDRFQGTEHDFNRLQLDVEFKFK